jgi:hypothetical protein
LQEQINFALCSESVVLRIAASKVLANVSQVHYAQLLSDSNLNGLLGHLHSPHEDLSVAVISIFISVLREAQVNDGQGTSHHNHSTTSHHIASHRIASHRIASHRIPLHHIIAAPLRLPGPGSWLELRSTFVASLLESLRVRFETNATLTRSFFSALSRIGSLGVEATSLFVQEAFPLLQEYPNSGLELSLATSLTLISICAWPVRVAVEDRKTKLGRFVAEEDRIGPLGSQFGKCGFFGIANARASPRRSR